MSDECSFRIALSSPGCLLLISSMLHSFRVTHPETNNKPNVRDKIHDLFFIFVLPSGGSGLGLHDYTPRARRNALTAPAV